MTITQNAGGGDWLDLPTRPVKYRGNRKPLGLPWAELTEQFVAAGGQVDAGVWHKGNVKILEGGRRGIDRIHTIVENDGYEESASAAPMRVVRKRTATASKPREPRLSTEQRAEIVTRYKAHESMTALAKAYGVTTGSINWALMKAGAAIRTPAEAGRLRRDRGKS